MKIFVSSDAQVDEALRLLGNDSILSADCETSGLDPYTCKLWSVQLGNSQDTDILFPWNALSEESREKVRRFCDGKQLVAHNAKFDMKFLICNGFDIRDVYCTQEIERVLYAGKYFTFKLKDLMHRYFQVEMSKEERAVFYNEDRTQKSEFELRTEELGQWGAWSDELIDYALMDIQYLLEIKSQQEQKAKELGMENVVWLETKLVSVTAKMELRGVWLDEELVKPFADMVILKRDTLERKVMGQLEEAYRLAWQKEYARRMKLYTNWQQGHQKVVAESNKMRDPLDKRRKTQEALDMVAKSEKKKPYANAPKQEDPFNINSYGKLKMALIEATGFPIPNTTKDWLEENFDIHPALEELVEYRKFMKLAQFTELVGDINEITGYIHANFHQNGTKTGRYSCSKPNLQQIPVRTEEGKLFRTMFKAPKGMKLVGADFEGIELVILAFLAREMGLIQAINEGKDVHCYTMSKFLGCSYEIIKLAKDKKPLTEEQEQELQQARNIFDIRFSMPDLQKQDTLISWVAKLRDYTKTMTYGVVYGLSPYGLSAKFHCEFKEAEAFIKLVFSDTYSAIKTYLEESGNKGLQEGYNSTLLGRRRWFSKPRMKSYEEIEKEVIKQLNKEKRLWDSVDEDEWSALVAQAIKDAEKELRGKINAIKRMSANSAIQGLSADITKLSMVLFEKEFDGGNEYGLNLSVHDELWALVKEEDAERAKEVMERSMKRAGNKFLPNMRIGAEAKIEDAWIK